MDGTQQTLNRNSKLPLYQQLYEILRDTIVRGDWQPGDMLPAEPELMDRYQVSRTTVRQVFDLLVNEGLVYRQQGRGTFVSHPTVEQTLQRIISFTDDMHQRGITPGTEVLAADLVAASEDVAARLGVDPGEQLVRLERLRLADGEPMSIEISLLVHHYCPGVLEGDYAVMPLREALEERYGIRWLRARQVIRAVQASPDIARLLSVSDKAALLFIERVSYDQQNVPVEFLRIYYRGDRYALHNELTG